MYTNDTERLFAEGGMNDDGGTVDPVSGNDVPPGSLQNEVRDDIDAKLSEGEFVIPADVVRYIGLERLMKIRDEAKAGLSRMAEIGQMGNADQVENPEALHGDEFSQEIDDIMSEVDNEGGEGEMGYAAGGVVKVPEASKDILAKYNIQRTAITNPANDVRLLKNSAGDSLYMTYFNGKPSGKIPTGYTVADANPSSRMGGTPSTTTTTPSTNQPVSQFGAAVAGIKGMVKSELDNPTILPDTTTPSTTNTTETEKTTEQTSSTAPNAAFMGDKGQGVNSYGGSITASDTGAVSTGVGGFTLNPDGSVAANTVDRTVMTVAGMVNPVLGVAARINNALATSSAKEFSAAIADTGGANLNATQPAATAGPESKLGTGGTSASAAASAADTATSSGYSDAAVGAASQAAADVIIRGGNTEAAAQAGRDAASSTATREATAAEPASQQTQTDIALGGQGGSAGAASLTSGADTAGRQEMGSIAPKGGEAPEGGAATEGRGDLGGGDLGGGRDGEATEGRGDLGGGDLGGDMSGGEVGGSSETSTEDRFDGFSPYTGFGGFGGGGGGNKYFEDFDSVAAYAKGGLVAKRTKKPTPARKRGIASKR